MIRITEQDTLTDITGTMAKRCHRLVVVLCPDSEWFLSQVTGCYFRSDTGVKRLVLEEKLN